MPFPRAGRAPQSLSAAAMSALLLASAVNHFRNPRFYRQVVPGYLCRQDTSPAAASGHQPEANDGGPVHSVPPSSPLALLSREEWIAASGLLELGAAVGILVPATRKLTATGLTAMYVAFLAGHVDALQRAYGPDGTAAQRKAHTVRLPFQVPLIMWAWSLRRSGRAARQ